MIALNVTFKKSRFSRVLLLTAYKVHCSFFEDHYIFLTFSRRHNYFFRNENMKNIYENFTSNICWLRLKIIFFMKMNSNIFANFTSNICSLPLHFCIFYLEYLLITITFLHILHRISAHYRYIFAYFASNICSLPLHFCTFYIEYLLISVTRI